MPAVTGHQSRMGAKPAPAGIAGLLAHPGIWRSGEARGSHPAGIPTGFEALDEWLPWGGWPAGALTEILCDRRGIGELRIVMPALARLSGDGGRLAWIAPPHIAYAPALCRHGLDLSRLVWIDAQTPVQGLWAAEQILRARGTGAALLWSSAASDGSLRRLQLAAQAGHSWGVLFGAGCRAARSSPAALRLQITPRPGGGLAVQVRKCRGRACGAQFVLEAV